jgi:two-component system, cell cycle response regulator
MQTIVVDPSRTVLKIVGQLLEAAGHHAHAFTDAREALDCLRSNPAVEAMITSVELPTMSGIDLCRMARALSSSDRPIYIMVMSSNREQGKLIKALEVGADDYIGKPPATEELYARLRAAERLGSMQRDLVRLATTDSLTALLNRRAFFEKAGHVCAHAHVGSRLSAIMFDIDHFKRINDGYGHGTGDQVIRAVAKTAAGTNEIVGRLGGEEFAMLLTDRALPDALVLAEKLRAAMAAIEIKADSEIVKVTLSFGVAEWEFGDTIDDLLRRTDLALYQAKATGRNCIIPYDPAFSAPGQSTGTGVIRADDR